MTTQLLKKWGNRPAVRIPAAVMQSAQLHLNQAVDVRAEDGRIIIEPLAPVYTLDGLLAGISEENLHGEFDFGGSGCVKPTELQRKNRIAGLCAGHPPSERLPF